MSLTGMLDSCMYNFTLCKNFIAGSNSFTHFSQQDFSVSLVRKWSNELIINAIFPLLFIVLLCETRFFLRRVILLEHFFNRIYGESVKLFDIMMKNRDSIERMIELFTCPMREDLNCATNTPAYKDRNHFFMSSSLIPSVSFHSIYPNTLNNLIFRSR
jgi:hypothetical protein